LPLPLREGVGEGFLRTDQGLLYCTLCRTCFTGSYAHQAGRAKPCTCYYRTSAEAAAALPADRDQLRAFFGRIGTVLEQAAPAQQHELLRKFIRRIGVTEDGLVLIPRDCRSNPCRRYVKRT